MDGLRIYNRKWKLNDDSDNKIGFNRHVRVLIERKGRKATPMVYSGIMIRVRVRTGRAASKYQRKAAV